MIGALVKDAVIDDLEKLKQSGHWIISKRGVGYVALSPVHSDLYIHGSATPNFNHVAQYVNVGWLSYHAGV